VPPVVQVVGAVLRGPNTVKVMRLVSLAPELDASVALMELALIAEFGDPVPGAETLSVGEAFVTVSGSLPVPVQGPETGLLFESPL
jgi:hypothetical protein